MQQEIMDAFVKGVSAWITSVFQTAAKKGLLILLLVGACIGETFAIVHLLREADASRHEFKIELKAELSDVRNEYRTELAACNKAREELSIRVAALSAEVAVLKNRKR